MIIRWYGSEWKKKTYASTPTCYMKVSKSWDSQRTGKRLRNNLQNILQKIKNINVSKYCDGVLNLNFIKLYFPRCLFTKIYQFRCKKVNIKLIFLKKNVLIMILTLKGT